MKHLPLLSAFIIILLLAACDSENGLTGEEHYSIKGEVKNAKGYKVYLEELSPDELKIIDTASVEEDGKFRLKGTLERKGIYRLKFKRGQSRGNLALADQGVKGIPLILAPTDKLKVEADINNFSRYTIEGSRESLLLKDLILNVENMSQKIAQLQAEFQQAAPRATNIDSLRTTFSGRYNAIFSRHNAYIKNYIDTVSSDYAALFAADFLNPKIEYNYLKKVAERLEGKLGNYVVYQNFKNRLAEYGKTAQGSEAPDITLPSPDGKELSLSSLKGKVVLLDFWASWCRPCRVQNPHLVELYNKFKDKDFEIFSVSLDQRKDRWVNAIKQDNLSWSYHVSDLKGWQSSAAAKYNVRSIPATFILNKEGQIIAANLRGQQLEDKLIELLGAPTPPKPKRTYTPPADKEEAPAEQKPQPQREQPGQEVKPAAPDTGR